MFEGSNKGISRMFQGSFKGVFKEDCGVFRETCKGDSTEVQVSLKIVSSVFLENFE